MVYNHPTQTHTEYNIVKTITRVEARAAGLARYYTGKPCLRGHVCERRVSSGTCVECRAMESRAAQKRLREEEPEKMKALKAAHYERRKEHIKERVNRNYHADIEKSRAAARRYAEEHRLEARQRTKSWTLLNPERRRANDKAYTTNNRGLVAAMKARYRASRRHATPPWVDDAHIDKIKQIYKEAERMSSLMGEPYHVDHIVPLQGGSVCGLHVWWNLRVIRGVDNNRRPRIWVDGPDGTYAA